MICESIRLFAFCDAMKWAHLPLPGGLYEQHPKLMDDFFYIFQQRAAWEASEAKKQEAKMKSQSKTPSRGRRR